MPTMISATPASAAPVGISPSNRRATASSTRSPQASRGWTTTNGAQAKARISSGTPSHSIPSPVTQSLRCRRSQISEGRRASSGGARRASTACKAMPRLNRTEETIPAINPPASIFLDYPAGTAPTAHSRCPRHFVELRLTAILVRKEHVKKSLLILPLLLLASALALTACGGGSSSSGGGEEAAIEEAIETAATTSDPSKCSEVQTEAFNEAETGTTGKGSLKACEEEAEEESEPAESVTVSNISEDGETATAEVEVEGGSLDGQSLEVELANEEGDWKLNEFLGFTNYNAANIAGFLESKLGEEEGVSASLAKCIGEGVTEMSQEDAEAMVFEKNSEPVEEIANSCNE